MAEDISPETCPHDEALCMGRRAPVSFDDWMFLQTDAIKRCEISKDLYDRSVNSGMPHWFLARVKRRWFERLRRLARIRRHNHAISKKLLDAIFERNPEG